MRIARAMNWPVRNLALWTAVALLSAIPSHAADLVRNFGTVPLSFESNQGQVAPEIQFVSRGAAQTLLLAPSQAVLLLHGRPQPLRFTLVDANPRAQLFGLDRQSGQINYFSGRDPQHWHTGIPAFARVKTAAVYPGIDLVFYGNNRLLEHDFILQPGADPARIVWAVGGADRITLDDQGNLVLSAGDRQVALQKPIAYQHAADHTRAVDAGFVLDGLHVGFCLGPYDPTLPLVIDPVLVFSTFLGGRRTDAGNGIAVDAAGNVYVAGQTSSINFPVTNAFQSAFAGNPEDAFVTKYDPTGTNLVYSTYLGGSDDDAAEAIAVDTNGNAYVTGFTASTDFPVVTPFQSSLRGQYNSFVAKLGPTGNLVYSTYLGGDNDDEGYGIAVDPAGSAYVAGLASSDNFPVTNAFQSALNGQSDAFLAKLSPGGAALVYSTYLGGSDADQANAIAVDPTGNAYITGYTDSTDFPTANPFQSQLDNGSQFGFGEDGFVTKLGPTGTNLIYSTYLGGSGDDFGNGIAVDSNGDAYVTGQTSSFDFPLTNAIQARLNNGNDGGQFSDAFVTEFNPTGSLLVYSTFLGGTFDDTGYAIGVDAAGNAYVTGMTDSRDFPLSSNTMQSVCRDCGNASAFVTKIAPGGTNFAYSTFLGGGTFDGGFAIAADATGHAYVTGVTSSSRFPRAHAYQLLYAGGYDAFVTKLADAVAHHFAVTQIRAPTRVSVTHGHPVTFSVTVQIQNRSQVPETIPDIATLSNLVLLTAEPSVTNCSAPVVVLHGGRPQQPLPVTLGVKKTLNVFFDVTLNCLTASPSNNLSYVATVNHAALPGAIADDNPQEVDCPRSVTPPYEVDPDPDGTIIDRGCGARKPDHTLGAPVLTDLVVR